MPDSFVGPKIEREPGGDTITVKAGGKIETTGTGAIHGAVMTFSVAVASATAGVATALSSRIASFHQPITVRRVSLLPSASCAGHATSNFTIAVRNIGTAAAGTTVVASRALTTGNALTLNIPAALTIATATADLDVAAGEALCYHYTLASSGIDFPPGTLSVDYVTRSA